MTQRYFIMRLSSLRHPLWVALFMVAITLGGGFLHTARASHDNQTLFLGAQGAFDDINHRNGVYTALRENWVAGLMLMTEQFVSVMMQQMFITATFLDAQQNLEVQRLYQELQAQAHKDFHPSFQMCQFGTTVKSIALADNVALENMKVLDAVLEKREHLHANLSASGGVSQDINHRIAQFKSTYCDLNEANRAVILLCNSTMAPVNRRTKDIDFARLIDSVYTLDANYVDNQQTDTEKDIIALSRNLYADTVIDFNPEELMDETGAASLFMEARSIHAIRSVARRSFTHIVGMKAEGDQNNIYTVRPFLFGILSELGVPNNELVDFLGENPSYFAQMEVLTRKIYQSPDFFTNLYDKPVNVRRIGVALQAIELMQDRDRYESALRREMLLSMIVELKLRRYQEDMNSILYGVTTKKFGRPEF